MEIYGRDQKEVVLTETLFAGAEGTEVFSRLGNNIGSQLHHNTTKRGICVVLLLVSMSVEGWYEWWGWWGW